MGAVLLSDSQISQADFTAIRDAASKGKFKNENISALLQKASSDGSFSEKELREVAGLVKANFGDNALKAFVDSMGLDDKLASSLLHNMTETVSTQTQHYEGKDYEWNTSEYGSDNVEDSYTVAPAATQTIEDFPAVMVKFGD